MAQALGPGKGHSFQGLWDTRLQAGEWDALGVSPAHTGVLILSLEAENCVLSAVVAALIPGERERARERALDAFRSFLCYHSTLFPWLPVAKERTLGKCRILMELSKERCQRGPCLF